MITEEDFERFVEWVETILNKPPTNPPVHLGLPMREIGAPRSVGFRGTWDNPHRWPDPQALEEARTNPDHT